MNQIPVEMIWREEGQRLQHMRETLHIGRYEFAKTLGVSYSSLRRLEEGERVRRRKMFIQSYKNALLLYCSQNQLTLYANHVS
ncbi:helix-turn-helix domain-containing protein [Megasphaera stantonii]|uniref:helix-turn-helix domain-containing protein n=1 Tax=Megasphaera stantonii TaxID=2144175 RepID=UPI0013002CBD|nr:helix-turn-helix transcriptional regulator [Megasphaera stantonii]